MRWWRHLNISTSQQEKKPSAWPGLVRATNLVLQSRPYQIAVTQVELGLAGSFINQPSLRSERPRWLIWIFLSQWLMGSESHTTVDWSDNVSTSQLQSAVRSATAPLLSLVKWSVGLAVIWQGGDRREGSWSLLVRDKTRYCLVKLRQS